MSILLYIHVTPPSVCFVLLSSGRLHVSLVASSPFVHSLVPSSCYHPLRSLLLCYLSPWILVPLTLCSFSHLSSLLQIFPFVLLSSLVSSRSSVPSSLSSHSSPLPRPLVPSSLSSLHVPSSPSSPRPLVSVAAPLVTDS